MCIDALPGVVQPSIYALLVFEVSVGVLLCARTHRVGLFRCFFHVWFLLPRNCTLNTNGLVFVAQCSSS